MTRSYFKYPAAEERAVRSTSWTQWLIEIRIHHWVKNSLVFVPLALSPQLLSLESVIHCALGFLALSIACSGSYLLNDFFDCEADRLHWSKCTRPVASGRISISQALAAAAGLCTIGLLLAAALNGVFAALLVGYLLMSLAYSYYLKTLALLDLAVLATMYALRVAMGSALIGVVFSPWLLMFVFLLFGGLATGKRTAELVKRTQRHDHSNNRRGYREEDLPLLIAIGISFSIGALIVLSVFLSIVAVPEAMFRSPQRLWLAVPLLLVWTLRFWVLSVRGSMADDPILFSMTDRISLFIGVLLGLSVLSIHLP